jgi:hypothetical protein
MQLFGGFAEVERVGNHAKDMEFKIFNHGCTPV